MWPYFANSHYLRSLCCKCQSLIRFRFIQFVCFSLYLSQSIYYSSFLLVDYLPTPILLFALLDHWGDLVNSSSFCLIIVFEILRSFSALISVELIVRTLPPICYPMLLCSNLVGEHSSWRSQILTFFHEPSTHNHHLLTHLKSSLFRSTCLSSPSVLAWSDLKSLSGWYPSRKPPPHECYS